MSVHGETSRSENEQESDETNEQHASRLLTTSARSARHKMACIFAGKLGTRPGAVSGVYGSGSGSREWST